MFGPPLEPPAPEPEISSRAGTLVAAISLTREPVGCEPYISIQYEISLRVFNIALILSKLEGSLNKTTRAEQRKTQDTQAAEQDETDNTYKKEPEDNKDGEEDEDPGLGGDTKENDDNDSDGDTKENGDNSLAGRKKTKY